MTAATGQGELLAQLRQSLGLLQVAFDAASEAMVIFDPEGVVRWGNQAAADLWTDGLAILLVGRHQEQLLQPIANRSGQPLERSSAEHPLQQWQLGDGGGVFHIPVASGLVQLMGTEPATCSGRKGLDGISLI